MPQPGGSAAINGILYQILGSVEWGAKLRLGVSKDKDGDIESTSLIIEPAGGGGDHQVLFRRHRIVEQWKSSPPNRTWSLNRLVDDVLPDLYLAVDGSRLNESAEYRFVTEGSLGRWGQALKFFQGLPDSVPDDPLGALEDAEIWRFDPNHKHTRQGFFKWIAERMRSHRGRRIGREPMRTTFRKLWHLLSRFTFVEGRSMEELERTIDTLLLAGVAHQQAVTEKRLALCGLLMKLAGKGEVSISPGELLNKVGLDVPSLMNLAQIHRNGGSVLQKQIEMLHYRPEFDIRSVPNWPHEKSVLVIAGESGQGKTWRLGALARSLSRPGVFVAVGSATGSADLDLERAGEVIWQQILRRDDTVALSELPRRIRKLHPGIPEAFVAVLVDGVEDPREAREVVRRISLMTDVRLAMTTSPGISRVLQNEFPDRVQPETASDFTPSEIRDCLHINGCDWTALPVRVRNVLWRPLVAGIYCDLTRRAGWQPTTEYEVYDRLWRRIAEGGVGQNLPQAAARFGALCLTVTRTGAAYPWTQSAIADAGIDDQTQLHLESVGWLSRVESGRAEVWHDRLLSWGLAKGLEELFRSKRITIDELIQEIRLVSDLKKPRLNQEHVLCDILWMLTNETNHTADVVTVLKAFEGGFPDPLYEELLPRLGPRVITSLEKRLRALTDRDVYPSPRLIASAMVRIGAEHRSEVVDAASRWIFDHKDEVLEAALLVLAKDPSGREAVLDRIWELHSEASLHLNESNPAESFWRYRRTSRALRASVQLNALWPERKIAEVDPASTLAQELTFLLADLGSGDGPSLWSRTKVRLLSSPCETNIRGVSRCIRRYHDSAEVEALVDWVAGDNLFVAGSAITTLSCLRPSRALEVLGTVDRRILGTVSNWWLPELIQRMPDETRRRLLELFGTSLGGQLTLGDIYRFTPELVDEETLDVLLDTLGVLLKEQMQSDRAQRDPPLRDLLDLLNKMFRLDQLRRFQARAGTAFEDTLLNAALTLTQAGPVAWPEAQAIARILLKIAGPGITQLVNSWLSERSPQTLQLGLQWAVMGPDQQTRRLLVQLASETTRPAGIVRKAVLDRLASLGEFDAIGLSVLDHPHGYSPKLAQLLDGRSPFGEEVINKALGAIRAEDSRTRIGGIHVLGLSGMGSLIPILHECVTGANPLGDEASAVISALENMKASDAISIAYLKGQTGVPENAPAAFAALLQIGTAAATKAAREYIESSAFRVCHPDYRLRCWEHFWATASADEHRSDAANSIRDLAKQTIEARVTVKTIKALDSIDDPDSREYLLSQALLDPGSQSTPRVVFEAIKTVARDDPDAGVRLAKRALARDLGGRGRLARLLVEITPDRAIKYLCEYIPHESRAMVRWAIGRALRGVTLDPALKDRLEGMCRDSDRDVREAAVELAGWLHSGALDEVLKFIAQDDVDEQVRKSAQRSLTRRSKLEQVSRLMEAFTKVEGVRRWVVLEAILQMADPYLILDDAAHEIELTRLVRDETDPMQSYVDARLKERFKELEAEAKHEDSTRDVWS